MHLKLFNGYFCLVFPMDFHGLGFASLLKTLSVSLGEFSDASAPNGSDSNFAWTIAYAPCALVVYYHPCMVYLPT